MRWTIASRATLPRRRVARRRRLNFPQSTGRGEQNIAFAMQAVENQLQQVLAWIAATDTPTDAQRLANIDDSHGTRDNEGGPCFVTLRATDGHEFHRR
jgi:hypothetical protein